jgi:hypothetical protein
VLLVAKFCSKYNVALFVSLTKYGSTLKFTLFLCICNIHTQPHDKSQMTDQFLTQFIAVSYRQIKELPAAEHRNHYTPPLLS